MKTRATVRSQQGVMLLEAMLGILLFSIGILAMIGLQTLSIGYVADAKYRADASFLANQIIGQIWVDQNSVPARYVFPGGTAPQLQNVPGTWINNLYNDLPGSAANPPIIAIVTNPPVPPATPTYTVTVTIRWLPPHAGVGAAVHTYTTSSTIGAPS